MPNIRIREKDLTRGELVGSTSNIFFLVDSSAEEIPAFVESVGQSGDPSFEHGELIERIINAGGKVLVCDTYAHAAEYLKDRNQFDVKFLIANEGEESASQTSELESALEITKARRDCCVLYNKITKTYSSAEQAVLSANIGGSDPFLASESKQAAGKYVISFFGNSLLLGEEEISAVECYILAYLNSIRRGNAEWSAIAGSDRGNPGLLGLECGYISETDLESMEARTGIAINPIMNMNPWGIRIWGNRTALPIPTIEGDSDLVASSFANIRVLICDIKKSLYRASRQHQFEQNNDVLWVNFQASVNGLLEEMKQSYGIAGYKWIREQTSERAKLKAILKIVPIEPVEDFDLTLELADSLEVSE